MADAPIPIRRKYTKRQKLAAVMAAEMAGVVQAEKQSGVPESTIRYWLEKPEFAAFRAKTREDLAEEVKIAAHLLWKRVAETASVMEPRDAIFGAEKAASILQLLSGHATARIETADLTATLDDHEREVLRQVVAEAVSERETADVGS